MSLINVLFAECSKCGVKYEIARGACIHFTCPNCKHQFCGTCLVPFIRDPVIIYHVKTVK